MHIPYICIRKYYCIPRYEFTAGYYGLVIVMLCPQTLNSLKDNFAFEIDMGVGIAGKQDRPSVVIAIAASQGPRNSTHVNFVHIVTHI